MSEEESQIPSNNSPIRELLRSYNIELNESEKVRRAVVDEARAFLDTQPMRSGLINVTLSKDADPLAICNDAIFPEDEESAQRVKDFFGGFYDKAIVEVTKMVEDEDGVSEELRQLFIEQATSQLQYKKIYFTTLFDNSFMIVANPNSIPLMKILHPEVAKRRLLLVNTHRENFPDPESNKFKAAVREEIIHLMDTVEDRHPDLAKGWMRDALAKVYLFDGIDGVRQWGLDEKEFQELDEFVGYSRHSSMLSVISEQSGLSVEEIYSIYFRGGTDKSHVDKLQATVDSFDLTMQAFSIAGETGLDALHDKISEGK